MTEHPFVAENLFRAAVHSYEEIQNVRLLVKGAQLALNTAEDAEDRMAATEILQAAMRKLDAILETLVAANQVDAATLIERVRNGREA